MRRDVSRWLAWGTSALLLLGCGSETATSTISRAEYVDAYVEILQAAAEAPDSATAEERVREILRQRELDRSDLAAFARAHADDPSYLAEVWDEIETRLREERRTEAEAEEVPDRR